MGREKKLKLQEDWAPSDEDVAVLSSQIDEALEEISVIESKKKSKQKKNQSDRHSRQREIIHASELEKAQALEAIEAVGREFKKQHDYEGGGPEAEKAIRNWLKDPRTQMRGIAVSVCPTESVVADVTEGAEKLLDRTLSIIFGEDVVTEEITDSPTIIDSEEVKERKRRRRRDRILSAILSLKKGDSVTPSVEAKIFEQLSEELKAIRTIKDPQHRKQALELLKESAGLYGAGLRRVPSPPTVVDAVKIQRAIISFNLTKQFTALSAGVDINQATLHMSANQMRSAIDANFATTFAIGASVIQAQAMPQMQVQQAYAQQQAQIQQQQASNYVQVSSIAIVNQVAGLVQNSGYSRSYEPARGSIMLPPLTLNQLGFGAFLGVRSFNQSAYDVNIQMMSNAPVRSEVSGGDALQGIFRGVLQSGVLLTRAAGAGAVFLGGVALDKLMHDRRQAHDANVQNTHLVHQLSPARMKHHQVGPQHAVRHEEHRDMRRNLYISDVATTMQAYQAILSYVVNRFEIEIPPRSRVLGGRVGTNVLVTDIEEINTQIDRVVHQGNMAGRNVGFRA